MACSQSRSNREAYSDTSELKKPEKSQINTTKRNKNRTQSQQKPADGTASISCYYASLGEGTATTHLRYSPPRAGSTTHHSRPRPWLCASAPGVLISDTGTTTAACRHHCAYTRPAPREPPLPFPRDLFLDTERKMHGENHLSEVIFFFFCLNNLTFTLDKVFCISFITQQWTEG